VYSVKLGCVVMAVGRTREEAIRKALAYAIEDGIVASGPDPTGLQMTREQFLRQIDVFGGDEPPTDGDGDDRA